MTRAEYFARECRKALAVAHQAEVSGDIEYADAAGQVAANKLAQAIRLASNLHEVPRLIGRSLTRNEYAEEFGEDLP